jgi:hypothetical protein
MVFLTLKLQGFGKKGQPHSSTTTLHLKGNGCKIPLACSKVRRSDMLNLLNKGFRSKTCFDKICLACAVVAPPVEKSVVRNICDKFSIQQTADAREKEDEPPVVTTEAVQRNPSKNDSNSSQKKKSKKK